MGNPCRRSPCKREGKGGAGSCLLGAVVQWDRQQVADQLSPPGITGVQEGT